MTSMMLNKDTKTIYLMTVIIFLYFFIFAGYDFVVAFSCACLYLSIATMMYATTLFIELIKGRTKNDSNQSD